MYFVSCVTKKYKCLMAYSVSIIYNWCSALGLYILHSWSPSICYLSYFKLFKFTGLLWKQYVLCSLLCVVCVCFVSLFGYLLSFWYRVSINPYIFRFIEFWICCHTPLQNFAYFRYIWHSCWSRFCFFYSNLVSWFILY
jgi:hypothetical protein